MHILNIFHSHNSIRKTEWTQLPEQELHFTLSNTNEKHFFALKTENNKVINKHVTLLTNHTKLYKACSSSFIQSVSLSFI